MSKKFKKLKNHAILIKAKFYSNYILNLKCSRTKSFIIESLVSGSSKEKLDSVDKINILLDFVKPLLLDSVDANNSW